MAVIDARRGSLPHLFPDRVPDRAMITMRSLAKSIPVYFRDKASVESDPLVLASALTPQ